MKISHNLKQDTSSEMNNSKTVKIRNKINERKQCQKQNKFNNKLERSAQKANTNTSAEMKISHNVKQDSFSEKNNSKTVEIGNKTNERKQCQKQNIFNNKLERSDQTANNNTSEEMKISQNVKWKYLKTWNENISKCEMKIFQNVKQDTSSSENSSQTVEIRNKTNERKQCQKQKIFNNKLERSDQKANTNFSADMKISPNVKQDTSWKRNSPQTVDIENKTNERKAMSKTKHM